MKSQEQRIAERLRLGFAVTPFGALARFGCMRLSGRILDLRRKGMDIETTMIQRNGKRYASYRLRG